MARKRVVKKKTDDLSSLHFAKMRLDKLRPYNNNPRINEPAVQWVMNSMRKFSFLVPILIKSADDPVIVAGHTRYMAAERLGMTTVPVVYDDQLTEEQADAFRLVDNKVSEQSQWDDSKLSEEITRLKDLFGYDFTQFSWTQQEIDCLSDLVADDCLSAGSDEASEAASSAMSATPRTPARARFVCAEFVFFVSQDVMRRWAAELRASNNYNSDDIEAELKSRLGLTPYEQR